MEEILKAVASGLKLDAARFLADFKNGDDWKPESEIAEQLGEFISDKVKAANETARKTGRSESSGKLARLIKNSGFENPDGLQGDELLKSFIEWKDEQTQHVDGEPAKLSKEELLKLPVVKSIVSEVQAKAGEKFAAEKREWEEKVRAAENTRKGLILDKTLAQWLEKAKVDLGATPETRSLRLGLLRNKIDLSRVEIGDADALKFLDKDGYETDYEKELVETATAVFGLAKQDPTKSGAGAQGSGSGAGGNGKYVPEYTFANDDDFSKQLLTTSDPAKRATMLKDRNFQKQKEAAGNAG